ncbi:TorF family putative porin [Tsuneonella sp. HG222]
MLTSIRSLSAATALAGAAFVSTSAAAQDAESDISVSANVALTTDYRFRGVSLSGGDPAIQGGVDVTLPAGFYVGTWASSIDGGAYGTMELDVYGGWTGEVASGVTFDVGLLKYIYPNGAPGVDLDYWEPYASVGFGLGPASLTVGAAYAWEQDSLGGGDNTYIYTDLEFGVPTTPVTLTAHVGYTDGALAPPLLSGLSADDSGFDYSIGASATVLGSLSLGVSYIGVDGPSVDGLTDDAIVATLSAEF